MADEQCKIRHVKHCSGSNWQKTRLRSATVFLLITFTSSFLVLQVSGTPVKLHQKTPALHDTRMRWHIRPAVHLLSATGDEKIQGNPKDKSQSMFIKWMMQQTSSKFKLEGNNTTVVVPKEGNYFVNLKINYIARECAGASTELWAAVKFKDSSYQEWRDVVKGTETMKCEGDWKQSLILSRVERFENGTKLRVSITPENLDFINWDTEMYFDIALL